MVRSPILLLMLLALMCAGCGGDKPLSADAAANSQSAYLDAVEAFDAKEFQRSSDLLSSALTGGGLTPDLYSEALIQRAICFARLDRFEEALADLSVVEQGAINMATVHMTRSFVLRKQGKTAESKSEASLAKKIDKRVKPIKD